MWRKLWNWITRMVGVYRPPVSGRPPESIDLGPTFTEEPLPVAETAPEPEPWHDVEVPSTPASRVPHRGEWLT